jgi:hypothetical protein
MSIVEIITLARSIARTMRDGIAKACRYLRSLNFPVEFACWALRGCGSWELV